MTAFADMIGALFADPNLAKDAAYVPPGGGDAIPCRAMATQPTEEISFGRSSISADTSRFDVEVSTVVAPAANGLLVLEPGMPGEAIFVIQGAPKFDRERLVWMLDTYPQGA